ncbi:hypothetical protein EDB84DRAFT_1441812 [Lactarius hengduanensis]|nr:hypothetical protein EDB84DRAFT_1441812 [Lactarius hengduanensis]
MGGDEGDETATVSTTRQQDSNDRQGNHSCNSNERPNPSRFSIPTGLTIQNLPFNFNQVFSFAHFMHGLQWYVLVAAGSLKHRPDYILVPAPDDVSLSQMGENSRGGNDHDRNSDHVNDDRNDHGRNGDDNHSISSGREEVATTQP